ncbi:MAG: EI24 domain-containing protein [Nitrospinota bacterium]|nr:EI24 domain-containing protein [Nitrospinota bacterium]MDH5678339.1 EI24 domain-containing protein [Nitrospinota bacterium]MDH5755371.1 EI24 domain-containing protein [Nitrospinota bacterium]
MAIRQTLDFTRGFLYFFRGLKTAFSTRALAVRAILPVFVNVFVFAMFLVSFNSLVYYLASWAFEQTSQAWYWAMLSFIAGAVLFVVSFLIVIFLFVVVGVVIASPFLDSLSIEVERHVTGKVEESGKPFMALAWLTIRSESKKLAVFLPIQLGLALLSLVPMVGPVMFAVINPPFLSFVMAYEFTSYTMDRRGYDFTAKKARIMEAPMLYLGFGAAAALTLFIPILHFLLLPAAVTGGSMLALDTMPKAIDTSNGQASAENGEAPAPTPETDG